VTRAPASFGMQQFRKPTRLPFALKEENEFPDQKQTEFTFFFYKERLQTLFSPNRYIIFCPRCEEI
jgi:hypothetical protein